MEGSDTAAESVREVGRIHRDLAERVGGATSATVGEVLNLGAAVLLHASLERLVLRRRHGLLDPAVVDVLDGEHARLARDLATLEELWRAEPDSADVAALSAAIFQRLREHLARDDRAIHGPLDRLERMRETPAGAARSLV